MVGVPAGKKSVENGGEIEGKPAEIERGQWGGQIEFILTMIGYAVGLGNVWRFPYLCYKNGGGAFLIPYVSMLILIGVPLFFMEVSFGQFASLGPFSVWRVNPIMKGIGFAMVITNMIIGLYYNIIIAWAFYYLFSSLTRKLPWEDCSNEWNDHNCFTSDFIKHNCTGIMNGTVLSCDGGIVVNRSSIQAPTEQFFYKKALGITDGIHDLGEIQWGILACLLLCWVIVFLVLYKGIASLGKVVYFSSIFPYVLLTIMLVRGVTLPGAADGLIYYLKPDFSKLSDTQVWAEAITQIFYSISACTGGLIAMASYNRFNNNILRDSCIVPVSDCLTSLYGGVVVFSMLGFMALQKGVTVDEVAEDGPGLVFIVYPEALTQMPVAPLWSVLFFLMLVMLGFSSEFSMVECFFSAFIDEFPVLRKSRRLNMIFRVGSIIIFFLISIPMCTQGGYYIFYLVDQAIGSFPLVILCIFELISLMYVYGIKNFSQDIAMMIGKQPTNFFKVAWLVIDPAILVGILIFMCARYSNPTLFSGVYIYPDWATGISWFIVVLPLVFVPGTFVYTLLREGGWQLIKRLSSPSPDWGPASSENRTGRYGSRTTTGLDSMESVLDKYLIDGQKELIEKAYAMNSFKSGTTNTAFSEDSQ